MKALILGLLLASPVTSHAAFTDCKYQEQACDAQGNHFYCVLYGWAVGEFCSATDVSRHPGNRFDGNCNPRCQPGYTCVAKFNFPEPGFYCRKN